MDVVDIDKILDDFELDEDRNARGSNQFRAQQVSSGRDSNAYAWGSSQPATPDSIHDREAVPQLRSHSELPTNKVVKSNFVNVSNVFMSLNEYVNAGIDTSAISQPIESYESYANVSGLSHQEATSTQLDGINTNAAYDKPEETILTQPDADANTDKIVPDQENCHSENQLSSGDEQSTSPISDDTTTISNTSSDVVNQCSEEAVLLANVNGTNAIDSDDDEESISANGVRVHDETLSHGENTASFTRQESITSYSSEDCENLPPFDQNEHENKASDKNQKVPVHPMDESSSLTLNTTVDESKTPSTSLPLPPSFLSSNNELSIIQSSSMITTLPPISSNDSITEETNDVGDVSESQAAVTHEEEELHCEEQLHKNDIRPCENGPHVRIDKIDDVAGILNEIAPEPNSDNRFIKPLCFEAAATMDDVSDTELESYLQELEDLEASPAHVPETAKMPSQMKTGVSSSEHNAESVGLRDENDKNADSFSQASTVEFADVGFEGDFHASNRNMNAKDWHTQLSSNETDQFSSEESNIIVPDSYGPHSEGIEPAQYLQRPNTLELPPSYNEAIMSSTAGLTPAISSSPEPNVTEDEAAMAQFEERNIPEESYQSIQSPSAPPLTLQQAQDPSAATDRRNTVPGCNLSISELGKVQPYWIPDSETTFCMQCNMKFSFIKRRHHCRACGQVLCSTCCSLKAKLEYMGDVEARICIQCDMLLNSLSSHVNDDDNENDDAATGIDVASAIDANQDAGTLMSPSLSRSPNPNNPMEYCSTIPPLQQVGTSAAVPPMVMVPGVLKREGASSKPARKDKNVMFSDGIRPGCDLTDLDNNWGESSGSDGSSNNYRKTGNRRVQTPPGQL